jgi:hypothetical protein
MQPAIYPQKPMPYRPPRYMDYLGKPAVFWRHGKRVEYLFMAEHPAWANQKRIPREECGAEYWRSLVDLLMIPNNSPDRATIEREAQTWYRFATTPAAFTGEHHG